MLRSRLVLAILACALAVTACEEQMFEDIEPQQIEIADFERVRVKGQELVVLKVTEVEKDMVHPEFVGRWTNLRREVEVDLYIMRLEDFDPMRVPGDPLFDDAIFWSSLPSGGVPFGDTRPTEMHVHPSPGSWVLFFRNPFLNSPTTEAELSAKIRLTFFR